MKKFVEKCDLYKEAKLERVLYPGLLQPLLLLEGTQRNITMNFIEGLPKSIRKNIILVIVDNFTKYRNFLVVTYPFTGQEIT